MTEIQMDMPHYLIAKLPMKKFQNKISKIIAFFDLAATDFLSGIFR